MTTRNTQKHSLRRSVAGVRVPAHRASLARVGRGHLDKSTSGPRQLVPEHPDERSPTSIEDASVETRLLADVGARGIDTALGAASHGLHVQLLDDHRAVVLGVAGAEFVQNVGALPADLPVQFGNTGLGLLSVLGSFLASGNGPLGTREALLCSLEESRVRHQCTVGVGEQVGDSTVDANDRFRAWNRLRHVNFAADAAEPLVDLANYGARLRLALKRAVNARRNRAELREHKRIAFDSEGLGCNERGHVSPFALPAGLPAQALETTLPRLVEFNKELGAQVTWHVGEPWQLSTQRGEFVDLVERCRITLLGPRKSHKALFVGEVPQKSQSALPRVHASNLLYRWVDAVSEPLADQHGYERSTRYAGVDQQMRQFGRKPEGVRPTPSGGVAAPET